MISIKPPEQSMDAQKYRNFSCLSYSVCANHTSKAWVHRAHTYSQVIMKIF